MMHGWGFGGMGMGGAYPNQVFEEQYHCYSVAYADKAHLEAGDKILLPPSAFDTLARLQVDYPMLFRLSHGDKLTHCGVLEFTAEEGTCYIPFWMMQNLLLEEGTVITCRNVSLPKATFVKLQPQHVDFLEISNPRAVLEHALRNFSCVTKGDVIQIPYNKKNYHFELKEVQPQDAACIIETDCNVDFDAPVGYKEPAPVKRDSSCPSPVSTTSTSVQGAGDSQQAADGAEEAVSGIRIVNGAIVRNDAASSSEPRMLAEQIGATGVQKNAAIPEKAPEVDYWAVQAGSGARLDGKKPAVLKDKDGNEVDVRKLRAEAAAKRAAAAATSSAPSSGGSAAAVASASAMAADTAPAAPVSKRKTKVGSKYSRLKNKAGVAFKGSAQTMH